MNHLEIEKTPTNDIVLFRSPATWTRKARQARKICEQWQGPTKRARFNNLMKWDHGWWHKYAKQARFLQYKS